MPVAKSESRNRAIAFRSGQEALHRVDGFPFLVKNEMTSALEYLDVRLGNEAAPQLGHLHRNEAIVLAPDQKRRHRQTVKMTMQFQIVRMLPQQPRQRPTFAI